MKELSRDTRLGRLRHRLYMMLEAGGSTPSAVAFDQFMVILILFNVIAVVLESVPSIQEAWADEFFAFDVVSIGIFTLEYFARLWVSIEIPAIRLRGPIVGRSTPPGVGGTIAGIVKTEGGSTALGQRKVTATNTKTGAQFEASTASNGGYTIQVPKGEYRLEVELRPGETLDTQPGSTAINVGDLDARRDFVVTATASR